MTAHRCAECRRILPAQGNLPSVDVLGRLSTCCGVPCATKLKNRLAAVIKTLPAPPVAAKPRPTGSAPANSAKVPTVVAALVGPLMPHAAPRTAPTGRRTPRGKASTTHRPAIAYCRNNGDQAPTCHIERCPCCGGLGVAMICPGCDGAGQVLLRTKRDAELAHTPQTVPCEPCRGRGWIPLTESALERHGFRKPPAKATEPAG